MSEPDFDRLEAFLKAYKRLIKKHGMFVTSCGCCEDYVSEFWLDTMTLDEAVERTIAELRAAS